MVCKKYSHYLRSISAIYGLLHKFFYSIRGFHLHEIKERKFLAISLGDGNESLTSKLLSLFVSWDVVAIDPFLSKTGTLNTELRVKQIENYCEKINIAELTIDLYDMILIMSVHGHGDVKEFTNTLITQYPHKSFAVLSIPCCFQNRQIVDHQNLTLATQYKCYGILSSHNEIYIWTSI